MSYKLLICGWYGTETLGDKAILGGIVQALENKVQVSFKEKYLVSLNPYLSEVTKGQMPELSEYNIVTLKEAYRLVGTDSVLIFGGGPLMAIKEISTMSLLFEKNNSSKGLNVLAGVGVGPFGPKAFNKYIRRIINLTDLGVFRDQKSLNLAKQIGGLEKAFFVAEDPSLSWITNNSKIIPVREDKHSKKVVLLCIRDFPFVEYAYKLGKKRGKVLKQRFDKEILRVVDELLGSDTFIVKPMPMCTNSYGGDDRWYLRNLLGDRVFNESLDSGLLNHELSPLDYLVEFKNCNFSLAMRFHSVLFSLGTGIKPFALDYTLGEGKVYSLIEDYNLPSYNLSDASEIQLDDYLDGPSADLEKPIELSFEKIFTQNLNTILIN
jgi:polysaccharide pyruvyl transferase WcaK-like protein